MLGQVGPFKFEGVRQPKTWQHKLLAILERRRMILFATISVPVFLLLLYLTNEAMTSLILLAQFLVEILLRDLVHDEECRVTVPPASDSGDWVHWRVSDGYYLLPAAPGVYDLRKTRLFSVAGELVLRASTSAICEGYLERISQSPWNVKIHFRKSSARDVKEIIQVHALARHRGAAYNGLDVGPFMDLRDLMRFMPNPIEIEFVSLEH